MELRNKVNNTANLQRKTVSFDDHCLEEIHRFDGFLSETERRAIYYSVQEVKSFYSQTKNMGRLLKKRTRSKGLNNSNQEKLRLEAQKDKNEKDITLTANTRNISERGCSIIYCKNSTLGMEKFLRNRSTFHPRLYVKRVLQLQEEQRGGIYDDPNRIASFLEACSRDSRKYALKIAAE